MLNRKALAEIEAGMVAAQAASELAQQGKPGRSVVARHGRWVILAWAAPAECHAISLTPSRALAAGLRLVGLALSATLAGRRR